MGLRDLSEKDFQAAVVDLAQLHGWATYHISDSRRVAGGKLVGDAMAAGLPDLILVHGSRGFVFAELKAEKGRIRPKQRECLNTMAAASILTAGKVRVHLWRPRDMDDVIMPMLARGEGPTTYGW